MENLKTDSPISRRIATAFLDFLKSVEPAAGVDVEGLEVVKEVLEEVFKLNPSSIDDRSQPGLLVEFFRSLDADKANEMETDPSPQLTSTEFPSTSSLRSSSGRNLSEASNSLGKDTAEGSQILEASEDELLRQFLGALDRVGFFNSKNDEDDTDKDLDPVDIAVGLFHEAIAEMGRSGIQLNLTNLADALKSRGNKAVQSKSYAEAIDLYSYAIALCDNNAVYYCNRAAAYTQIQKYVEAIRDCQKSISIDPRYSKAYSRLGLVYYAQGNYRDAISKGFNKALRLDPSSESIKENMRVAKQKLIEEMYRNQGAGPSTNNNQEQNGQPRGGSWSSHGIPTTASFTLPFSVGSLPSELGDFANMFMNMGGNAHPGPQQSQENNGSDRSRNEQQPQPEIRMDINIEGQEALPEELMGSWRSMMGMFASGGVPQSQQQQPQQPEGDMNNRGPTPN
ncbi:hypothetical protein MKW92_010761 [Papaver armeniacum]|nr:hypothetical protein MKW92_010761 [Papaver armeniacum]